MEYNYKKLAAQRLAIDPNELLSYFEVNQQSFATTPDGKQHIFTFAHLRQMLLPDAMKNDLHIQIKSKPVAKKQSAISNQKSKIQ
jgi:hypothetical protein